MTDAVTVKTTENTNTPGDLRRPDVSWGWRRTMFFSVVLGCLAILGWIVLRRPISDPVILLYVRYNFWTLWIGLLMYGAQGTMSELALVISAFLSGKRVTETTAPKTAVVETTPTGAGTAAKVVSGEPAATIAASDSPPPAPAAPPAEPAWPR